MVGRKDHVLKSLYLFLTELVGVSGCLSVLRMGQVVDFLAGRPNMYFYASGS